MVVIDAQTIDLLVEVITEACEGRLELIEIEDVVDRILVLLQKKGFQLVSINTQSEPNTNSHEA